MKKNILNSIVILGLVVVVLGGIQAYASTYSEPADQSQNAFKPLNIGPDSQVMDSSFYSRSFLKAGNTATVPPVSTPANPTWNTSGSLVAEKAIITPRLVTMGNLALLSKQSQIKIGSSSSVSSLPAAQPFTGDQTTPVIIDMRGRGAVTNDPRGRQAIELLANGQSSDPQIQINTPALQFSSTSNTSNGNDNRKADLIVGGLRLPKSQPANEGVVVLVATDTAGNAVWGTMRVATNTDGSKRIQVDYPGSPVATGQAMCN